MLADGQPYGEYKDPWRQVAKHIWKDVQEYQIKSGTSCHDFEALNV
jgi:nitrate/TMAO reductase-like tetraheme cytochrome c subunit